MLVYSPLCKGNAVDEEECLLPIVAGPTIQVSLESERAQVPH